MPITLGTSVSVTAGGANGPTTTAAITTTGATMIELTVSWYTGASGYPTVSDNKGNAYTALGVIVGVGASLRKFYTVSPTVGTGHTFTVNHTGGYAVLWARTYSGAAIQFDSAAVPSGSIGTTHPSAQTFNSGSLTPSANGALITSALTHLPSISGLAVTGGSIALVGQENFASGQNVGSAIADFVQTTAAAINPLWSWTTNAQVALTTVAYIVGSGSPSPSIDSQANLLTGFSHLNIRGSGNLLSGNEATVDEADLVALFSLDGLPHTEDRDHTFCVHADNICLNGELTINGNIFEAPGSPGTINLDDLGDVVITSPQPDDVLTYDGAEWVNSPVPTGSPGASAGWYPAFTAPVDGDFSWVNQGGASVTAANDAIYLLGPAGAGENWRVRIKTAPSPPYVITAAFIPNIAAVASPSAGFAFRQSSDGKMHVFTFSHASSPVLQPQMFSMKLTSATVFSATYSQITWIPIGAVYWFRIEDNNTNRICSYSRDGYNWTVHHSVSRTDFLTADQVGFVVNSGHASHAAAMTLLSWEQT
jgi:hypothetical protein